jgi:phosphopantothenoylcysteine decarboxylase/phosphopantothenate--cysteine ligase
VSGKTALAAPPGVERVDVLTAREMHQAVMARAASSDVFIGVAAVADYRAAQPAAKKIKRADARLTIELAPNPDILADVAALRNGPFCVGFAAETENMREHAQEKLKRKNIPLIAANVAQEAFGSEDNALTLFYEGGEKRLERAPKIVVARQLIAHIAGMLPA